jgi:hypothetical protein
MNERAVLKYVFGLGGRKLDPVNGAALFLRRVALIEGVSVTAPYSQATPQLVVDAIKRLPPTMPLILIGDSCGGNKLAWIAQQIYPRRVAFMGIIQASWWCQYSWIPPIDDNVDEMLCIYSSWWKTGGFGVYKPRVAPGNARTRTRYIYVNDLHPGDDDVTGVQNPLLVDITRIVGAA